MIFHIPDSIQSIFDSSEDQQCLLEVFMSIIVLIDFDHGCSFAIESTVRIGIRE